MSHEITLKTWGNRLHRKGVPFRSDRNFNVAGISDVKPKHLNLRDLDGRDAAVQAHVSSQPAFRAYCDAIVAWILAHPDATVVSINCHKGRHRSVAVAQLLGLELAHKHGIIVNIVHYDL